MRLDLGRRSDYAIRVVLDLARRHPDQLKAREIATEMDIPRSYVPRILALLVGAGLVQSRAGPAGGYQLIGAPATISLLAVVEAADGRLRSTECVLRGGPCRWNGTCVVHEPWVEAQEALRTRLEATTFADLATVDAATRPAANPPGVWSSPGPVVAPNGPGAPTTVTPGEARERSERRARRAHP